MIFLSWFGGICWFGFLRLHRVATTKTTDWPSLLLGGISAELPIAASRGGVQGDIRGMLSCIASSSTNMAIENPPFLIGETHLEGWSIFHCQPCGFLPGGSLKERNQRYPSPPNNHGSGTIKAAFDR